MVSEGVSVWWRREKKRNVPSSSADVALFLATDDAAALELVLLWFALICDDKLMLFRLCEDLLPLVEEGGSGAGCG